MSRSDLEYIAGMNFPHPDLLEDQKKKELPEAVKKRHEQLTKLTGNVARARAVLQRRNLFGRPRLPLPQPFWED